MSLQAIVQAAQPRMRTVYVLLALAAAILLLWRPGLVREVTVFVTISIIHVMPIVIPGVLLAAWITASGASTRVVAVFHGRTVQTVLAASAVGALLPVCGVTILPLMAGLLAGGVPLAPVMAFWLSSPITGPALLSTTAATLGWSFALGKMLAAIGLVTLYRINPDLARDQVLWLGVGTLVFVALLVLLPDHGMLEQYRYLI